MCRHCLQQAMVYQSKNNCQKKTHQNYSNIYVIDLCVICYPSDYLTNRFFANIESKILLNRHRLINLMLISKCPFTPGCFSTELPQRCKISGSDRGVSMQPTRCATSFPKNFTWRLTVLRLSAHYVLRVFISFIVLNTLTCVHKTFCDALTSQRTPGGLHESALDLLLRLYCDCVCYFRAPTELLWCCVIPYSLPQ